MHITNRIAAAVVLAGVAVAGVFAYLGLDLATWGSLGISGLSLAAVVQSTYSERIAVAVAGMIANENPFSVDSRIIEPTSGAPFGRALGQGTNDRGAVLGGTLANFVGVSVRDITLAPQSADSDYLDEYTYKSTAAVLTMGDIWVSVKEAVLAGGVVHYDATTGQFGDTGGSGPIPGARWMTTQATTNGLALLRLSGLQRT